MKKFALLAIVILFYSCSAVVRIGTTSTLPPNNSGEVIKIENQSELPSGSKKIGTFYFGDKGLTTSKRCEYSDAIEELIKATRKIGGNAYIITKEVAPYAAEDYWSKSTCWSIYADIYLITK
ncbi:MAG: hypothetical protein LBN95_07890 [Prevotellaceae bacterium]|jgi:hypothetical protein|nr:hypothetical protein [Prevotellaceae bacterium]